MSDPKQPINTVINVDSPQQSTDHASGSHIAMASGTTGSGRGSGSTAQNDTEDTSNMSSGTSERSDEAPRSHIKHGDNWFKPGRFFNIWAPESRPIHNKKFILLDSSNTSGNAVLVGVLSQEELAGINASSDAHYTHLKLQRYDGASVSRDSQEADGNLKTIQLDRHSKYELPENMYVHLEHTFNIQFSTYKCEDHGMLRESSLKTLRLHHITDLLHHYQLWDDFMDDFGKKHRP